MPAPYFKYNIHIDHSDSYTLTEKDHENMVVAGLVPGNEAHEIAYIHNFIVNFPDVFIGKFMVRERALGNPTKFPDASATITKVTV